MRQAALQGRISTPTSELDEDELDDSSIDSGPLSKRMKVSSSGDLYTLHVHSFIQPQCTGSKRSSKGSVIDLLKDKYEKKADLKEKELELQKMELMLQE